VSLEERYGTWGGGFLRRSSESAAMTLARANRPTLMEMLSFSRSPSARVRFSRSDPARSTKWNLEQRVSSSPSALVTRCSKNRVTTAWERDDVAFISVAPVARVERLRREREGVKDDPL
jgi:hypothetical protein